jgi:ribonuclease E
MGNKMLIDAAHPEETRVVVVRGNRVEEFDFESQARKQLRGSIFLAKVIRVEPSLQAAFVDYGGNRHGFLAFAEIHPDYYRLPHGELSEHRNHRADAVNGSRHEPEPAAAEEENQAADDVTPDADGSETARQDAAVETVRVVALEAELSKAVSGDMVAEAAAQDIVEQISAAADGGAAQTETQAAEDDDEEEDELSVKVDSEHSVVESVGGEDALEELPQRERQTRRRHYKIQEVIKRNQILLVQVVKEERGTKGAALTTYLSLAGRYTVLMPNTASGGGISRKINVVVDRKRLKEIATELDVPQGMGLIIRTAGAARTKAEIKRDFEYLLRLWETVRDLTLKSKAPTLVYEEGDLIKRSIRDLYNREIDEVLVAGDDAYREAKDFMRMLMPSHAKNVQPYKEPEPIFTRHGVEGQLNMMFNPRVTLKSGGYIIINQTEALVAVDVNSGKSTREHSIEETALKTNMEAADEVARQLRLRDLAGLIVIDFIDMEERRNNRTVEKKLKDCLRNDRARIQVGRISPFGLLEMSRQRLRTGMVEGSTQPCQHCNGTGVIRSTESVALMVLRAVEDMLIAKGPANLMAHTTVEAALYILNNKRNYLRDIESRYGVTISVAGNATLFNSSYTIEKIAPPTPREGVAPKVQMTWAHHAEAESGVAEDHDDMADAAAETAEGGESRSRRRRRRKRGRNGQDYAAAGQGAMNGQSRDDEAAAGSGDDEAESGDREHSHAAEIREDGGNGQRSRRRRRGRRGGQRSRALDADAAAVSAQPDRDPEDVTPPDQAAETSAPAQSSAAEAPPVPEPAPHRESAPPEHPKTNGATHDVKQVEAEKPATTEPAPPPEQPRRTGPARGGWWQRRIGG